MGTSDFAASAHRTLTDTRNPNVYGDRLRSHSLVPPARAGPVSRPTSEGAEDHRASTRRMKPAPLKVRPGGILTKSLFISRICAPGYLQWDPAGGQGAIPVLPWGARAGVGAREERNG